MRDICVGGGAVHIAISEFPVGDDEGGAARELLRGLLTSVAEQRTAVGRLEKNLLGRPYLPDSPSVGVSISHSPPYAAAAVSLSHSEVGIDVQVPVAVTERFVRRCCSAGASYLMSLKPAERDLETAWIWSVQEACAKASGLGLAVRPWTIEVPVQPRSGRWGDYQWLSLRGISDVPLSIACRRSEVEG